MSARTELNLEADFRPPGEDCRALVARIAASREFQRASRLRAFLTYVVDRKLADCPDEITEVLIGHRVFGLPLDYNPGDNSIVRTQARTLRDRLERYFRGEGAHEPVMLEIPTGAYVPVFRLREVPQIENAFQLRELPQTEPRPLGSGSPLTRRHWIWLGASAAGLAGIGIVRSLRPVPPSNVAGSYAPGRVQLESSDARLTQAFGHAKERAMQCVYAGDPIGDWYASDPNSRTFCMRDVSHESLGAAVLGLTVHTENMLRRFAHSIALSRKWCGFWTITKDGFPSPDTYRDHTGFGYCLPANFDLVRACYHQLRWTGNRSYLDAVFSSFYDHTVTSYVSSWDKERSGWMKAAPESHRVHASYNQRPPQFATSADLLAAQYAAYLAYAGIGAKRKTKREARNRISKASAAVSPAAWRKSTVPRRRHCAPASTPSGGTRTRSASTPAYCRTAPFRRNMSINQTCTPRGSACPAMARKSRRLSIKWSATGRNTIPHTPISPKCSRATGGPIARTTVFSKSQDPGSSNYARGETAFAALGAIAAGLMGLDPDVPSGVIETLPRLTRQVEWARLSHMPVGPNEIAVEHRGATTTFTNQSGPPVQWRPRVALDPVTVRGGETRTAKLS